MSRDLGRTLQSIAAVADDDAIEKAQLAELVSDLVLLRFNSPSPFAMSEDSDRRRRLSPPPRRPGQCCPSAQRENGMVPAKTNSTHPETN
jgi:hypothetical protein